jgi:hypothetical protein
MPSSPHAARPAKGLGLAVLATSLAACAGIVGADFDSVHGAASDDGGVVVAPAPDAQAADDAAVTQVAPPSDGGACPTRFLDCGGECFDISTSPLHCGDCATACNGDPNGAAVCVASHCELACNPGYAQCATGCCAVVIPDASSSGEDASASDASTGADAGEDAATTTGIPCAATTCADGTDFCCGAAVNGQGTAVGDTCLPTQNDTSGFTCPYVFACAGTADCQGPGGVCCYDTSSDTRDPNYQSSFCAQSCGGDPYVQLCTPGSNDCLGGATCGGVVKAQGLETTYGYCD